MNETEKPTPTGEAGRAAPAARPGPRAPVERVVVIPTRVYWLAFGLSLLFVYLAVAFYRDYTGSVGYALMVATVAIASFVLVWSFLGLVVRGRVLQRTGRGTKRFFRSVARGVEARSEANEGALERFIDRWRGRFIRLGRLVWKLIRLPFLIIRWLWYTSEKTFWRLLLLLYDLLYYPLYAAWLLLLWALRVTGRILAWALRVVWRILKPLTYLPIVKRWWRETKRPQILANWRALRQHWRHRRRLRIDSGRRRAALHGNNPDRWEADYLRRRAFPLPHPEGARTSIRKRIAFILEVQHARRMGRPVPKWKKPARPTEPAASEQPSAEAQPFEAPPEGQATASGPGGRKKFRGLLKGKQSGASESETGASDA